jgi:hypothetical protein
MSEAITKVGTCIGTCIVCQREIAVRIDAETGAAALVHHGYRRPGDGAIHGDCFAVGKAPHEISADTAVLYRDQSEAHRLAYLDLVNRLETNQVATLHRPERLPVPTTQARPSFLYGDPRDDPGWEQAFVAYQRDDAAPHRQSVFQDLRRAAIAEAKQRAEWSESEVRRMQKAIDTWTLQELRDRPKAEPSTKRRRRRMRWPR